jgi:N-acetylglucosaminyldiphosphoundecaprenol N-acetyl-beta-D-mannosaminyltransferase
MGISFENHTRRILGINFFIGKQEEAVDIALKGGLVVAPSGPGLALDLVRSQEYRKAVTSSDIAIIDSSALVLCWYLIKREWLPRLSGLMFIRSILQQPHLKEQGAVFWVMPSVAEQVRNLAWLNSTGFCCSSDDCYIAPFYEDGEIKDNQLAEMLKIKKPKFIIIAIGGGVQEQLGLYLREQLPYKPSILCLGAAIAFLSGGQAPIPAWADTLMLGWLLRILFSPRRFLKRYYEAWRLLPLVLKFNEKMPPIDIYNSHMYKSIKKIK